MTIRTAVALTMLTLLPAAVCASDYAPHIDGVKLEGNTLEIHVYGGTSMITRFDLVTDLDQDLGWKDFDTHDEYVAWLREHSDRQLVLMAKDQPSVVQESYSLDLSGIELLERDRYWLIGYRLGSIDGVMISDSVDISDVVLRGRKYQVHHIDTMMIDMGVLLLVILVIVVAAIGITQFRRWRSEDAKNMPRLQ